MPLIAPRKTAPMLVWAKWWVEQGWSVFPLHPREKEPATKNGFKDATTDADQINLWWTKNPDYNIGGVPPVDHFMVDIDGPTDLPSKLPATWEHTTDKGKHSLFKQNAANPVPHGQKIWPNVDTRLNGKGYVCLPPSVHPNGSIYELTAQLPVAVFPSGVKPDKGTTTKPKRATKDSGNDDVVSVLLKAPDDPTAGDDDMIKVAGYLARYLPDRDVFVAMLTAINCRLTDPLSDSAMDKKFSQWDRHREVVAAKEEKRQDDESRGWLFPREVGGYDTPIEGRDGSITYMPITDFTMEATGVIVSPGFAKRVFIVDCTLGDGTVLVGQKIDTDTMCDMPRFKKWLARRGMSTYDHRKDPRGGALGQRLIKLLENQEPPTLESRDHYGWCAETEAFLIEQGEVTADGLRGFTSVYPDDKLRTDSPSAFSFDADMAQAREWLSRVLALQPEREAAKVGSWAMMLLLRGQWSGLLPGLLVQASAGTGKTRFFQLLFKLLGSTNEGESLTLPAMRDKLLGNTSNAVWLDDVHLDDKQQQLMRGALTNGKVTLKQQSAEGWETIEKHMRASIVVSGEGVDWYRQKALRDRFIEVNFDTSIRTVDADKLVAENIGRASGALLAGVLGEAGRLTELEALREGVRTRDDHARTTLRIGARILDAVLGTGHKWTRILDGWYLNEAVADDLGQASESVLNVFPVLWKRKGMPVNSGQGRLSYPIWYDEVTKTFWVHAMSCADEWNQTQKNLDARQRQLTDHASITRELNACGAGPSTNKPTMTMGGDRKAVKYRQVPVEYSRMILNVVDHAVDEDEEENNDGV